jgi:hypothetical protein
VLQCSKLNGAGLMDAARVVSRIRRIRSFSSRFSLMSLCDVGSVFLMGAQMWMTVSVAAIAVPLLIVALYFGVRLDTPGANESGPRIGF